MQATVKLAVMALALAAVAAANVLHAHVGSPANVIHRVVTAEAAKSPAYADWHGTMTQSFGDRFLGRGSKGGPGAAIRMFEGMKKL
jgi:hypothetical protein